MKNPSPEQVKQWNRTYYEKNKEKRRAQYNQWRADTRSWFHELKKEMCCSNCGFDHVAALQFHHTDPLEKEYTIAEMIGKGCAKKKILSEIEKCVVLCANCHAVEHYNQKLNMQV